jgi:hypothetical protein
MTCEEQDLLGKHCHCELASNSSSSMLLRILLQRA